MSIFKFVGMSMCDNLLETVRRLVFECVWRERERERKKGERIKYIVCGLLKRLGPKSNRFCHSRADNHDNHQKVKSV